MNSCLPALCFLQELAAEKAKAAAGEAKVKKQLVAREQEITAVQARMQASYREHVKEVQQLQGKVGTASGQVLMARFVARFGGRRGAVLVGWLAGVCVFNVNNQGDGACV